MKGHTIERLARKHLLPVLPGFVARRSLVYRRPVGYFLHGLSFETSSFTSSRIFVEAFVRPLYEPHDYITYTYGFRLGNDFWDVDEQVLHMLDDRGLEAAQDLLEKWRSRTITALRLEA